MYYHRHMPFLLSYTYTQINILGCSLVTPYFIHLSRHAYPLILLQYIYQQKLNRNSCHRNPYSVVHFSLSRLFYSVASNLEVALHCPTGVATGRGNEVYAEGLGLLFVIEGLPLPLLF